MSLLNDVIVHGLPPELCFFVQIWAFTGKNVDVMFTITKLMNFFFVSNTAHELMQEGTWFKLFW